MHNHPLRSCLVIPCYNEAERLPVKKFVNFLLNHNDYDLVFVNDGSTDKTSSVLNKMKMQIPDRIEILSNIKNSGKGEAVRVGMTAAANKKLYNTIGYLDADLSIPLIEYKRLNKKFKNNLLLFVFGSRVQRVGALMNKTMVRHIISRTFATVASSMLKIPVYDTQCGIKIFRASIVSELFKQSFVTSWIFDLEIFFRFKEITKNQSIHKIAEEIPLNECNHVNGSKISIVDYFKIPLQLLKIRNHYQKNSSITF